MVFETPESPPKKDFLPYELGYLTPDIVKVAEKELNEKEESRKKGLADLRDLIKGEEKLYVRTDDIFLLSFLRARKYNVQKAFKTIQNYYRLRLEHRHIYDCNDNSVVHEVFRQNFIGFLPYRDEEGRVILLIKCGLWDPDIVPRDLLMWTLTHCMIHSIEDEATQILGYTMIVDLRGINHKHFLLCTPENIMLVLHSTQSCFPGRYKGIHFIGGPKLFTIGWAIIQPFLPLKIKQRVFLHGDDFNSLHKHIPPSVLPSECGGELGPFDNSEWHAKILSRNEWAMQQGLYGYR